MNEIIWSTRIHKDTDSQTRVQIAELKNQHWKYGIESQLQWMKNHILSNDIHLLGYQFNDIKSDLVAYLTIVNLSGSIDYVKQEFFGIGGVCISKKIEHFGYGRQLMQEANHFIEKNNRTGLLLCKNSILPFYQKCGWHIVRSKHVTIDKNGFDGNVLAYPYISNNIEHMDLNRVF